MIGASVVQTAIYAELTTPAMSAQVFDAIPQGTSLGKYVVLGTVPLERPFDTHDSDGSDQFHQVDVWSNAAGSREVQLIMDEIDARLHNARLALSSGHMLIIRRDFATVFKEPESDGKVWRHGVLRYRAIISE